MPDNNTSCTEEIKITADKLIETIKNLLHEGNVRHIAIKDQKGDVVFEVPVTLGLVGILLAPVFAAIGALAVYAADYTIVVTRDAEPETNDSPK
jgi:hypothetical protein